jgi:uncharacterized protein YceH (UPF0502 family)
MLPKLRSLQARVIGVLLEKEVTTPDQYPLTLNALTTGCNQKSNREPVMSLSESDVQNVIDELLSKGLLFEIGGNRAMKYKHRFCNTEFNSLKFSRQQTAIVCVLLLRGAQTPGELRTRTNRLAEFENVQETEAVLDSMLDLNGERIVVKLAREPGKRESRYQHMFCDAEVELSQESIESAPESPAQQPVLKEALARIEKLEAEVAELKEIVNILTDS